MKAIGGGDVGTSVAAAISKGAENPRVKYVLHGSCLARRDIVTAQARKVSMVDGGSSQILREIWMTALGDSPPTTNVTATLSGGRACW